MSEREPRQRGDIPKTPELDVTEQFLTMGAVEFREFLDDYLKNNKDSRVTIEVSDSDLTDAKRTVLRNLQLNSRVKAIIKE
ncbi:MAG: hypothetical protein HYW51_00555 [Candidatus Doudnabacteria bacterium]|nr:hypothetical protein [Candidatus Doudnabacteria bacterium]